MVQAAAGGEGDAGLQPVHADELPDAVLQGLTQVDQADAGLGNRPDIPPHLWGRVRLQVLGFRV